MDSLTKYAVLKAVRDAAVKGMLRTLEDFVLDFGAPRRIISDGGASYASKKFSEFCAKHGREHVLNSPRHAQANCQIERLNRTLLPAIQVNVHQEDGRDWDARPKIVQRDLNESPKTTGKSPFRALYGYAPRHDEGVMIQFHPSEAATYQLPERVQQEVREKIREEQQKFQARYDRKRRCVKYDIGDIVYMKTAPTQTGESQKLQRIFRGPLTINRIIPGGTYGVVDLAEHDRGRRYAATAHTSQLKLWRPAPDEGPDNRSTDDTDEDDGEYESVERAAPSDENDTIIPIVKTDGTQEPSSADTEVRRSSRERCRRDSPITSRTVHSRTSDGQDARMLGADLVCVRERKQSLGWQGRLGADHDGRPRRVYHKRVTILRNTFIRCNHDSFTITIVTNIIVVTIIINTECWLCIRAANTAGEMFNKYCFPIITRSTPGCLPDYDTAPCHPSRRHLPL